jgi:hypothetical protein
MIDPATMSLPSMLRPPRPLYARRVPIHWDDIEILRILDERERGDGGRIFDGFELINTVAARRDGPATGVDYHSFLQELFVLQKAGLLTWELTKLPPQVRQLDPSDAQYYLQNVHYPALTFEGRNTARGRIIFVPPPEPDEDDGRSIPGLIIKDIAVSIQQAVGGQDDFRRELEFLAESGISPENLSDTGSSEGGVARQTMEQLHRGTSAQRRELRQFIARWLEGALYAEPSDTEYQKIVGGLARQGWFVKDGRIVIGEPVRNGRKGKAPSPALDELHPTVWDAAAPQWKVKHLHDAVMDASKAVNAMLQAKVGRDDVSEVKLVQPAFSSNPPTADERRFRFPDIADQQTRDSVTAGVLQFGVGCFKAIRNPIGHLPDDQHEITEQEALEQLAAWSLFARWIERAEVEG